ncbi:hypothetical protein DFQ27_000691 [Actinomortierella ambigua]|uniref:Uncharacterized protein n=1 Tax=Actinomortierella ambigua TaxID=1343610 RepID=A0A9P6U9E0_9FUNG|nr:hypothetical protein DFQ27_000691 [Actinomortierella ambigua]
MDMYSSVRNNARETQRDWDLTQDVRIFTSALHSGGNLQYRPALPHVIGEEDSGMI